jgi:effector-binding domain-containing protein
MATAFRSHVMQEPSTDVEEVALVPRLLVGVRAQVAVSELGGFFARALPAVAAELERAGIRPAGPPITTYRGEQGNTFEVTTGFPVDRPPTSDALVRQELPGGRAVQSVHNGSYDTLPEVYARISGWFTGRKIRPPDMMWEEYLVGPDVAGETGCVTRVVFPLGTDRGGRYGSERGMS